MFYMNHPYKSIHWLNLIQLEYGQTVMIHFRKIMPLLLDHEEFIDYWRVYWLLMYNFRLTLNHLNFSVSTVFISFGGIFASILYWNLKI